MTCPPTHICHALFNYLFCFTERISINQASIKTKVNGLLSAAQVNNNNQLKKIITSLIDMVASFENHCKVMLLKEGLRDWYNSLDPAQIPGKNISYIILVINSY